MSLSLLVSIIFICMVAGGIVANIAYVEYAKRLGIFILGVGAGLFFVYILLMVGVQFNMLS